MSKTNGINGIIRLNEINDKTRTKTIAVRILRLWVQKDLSGKEGLEMIIIDEWGDKIQASISVGLKRKFIPLLKEGHIILIKNFQVLENKPNFQSAKIKHEKRIGFGLATKVLQSEECLKIAENGFNFISFTDICKHDTSLVLDVLGEVKTRNISIESVEMRNGKAAKCDITLVDADGTQLTCVLWESFANQLKLFMYNMSTGDTEPVIVALQIIESVIKVSTMKHASRFFIRPDIQEVKDFILRRGVSGVSSSHTISDISNGVRELNSEEWLNVGSLRTIKEIVNSDAVGTYTCRWIIVDFHPEESWYYQSCGNNRCYKGVPKGSKVGDYCKKCSGPIGSIIIRYLMKVLVADGDEQAYFTFFEDCALYFLKKTANQVMEEMEEQTGDSNGTPDIMSTMLDRECLFKVEVAVRFGDRVYTVKNVTEDAEMMAQFSSIAYAERKVSTSKKVGTSIDNNVVQEDHVAVIEQTSSSSTMSEITPHKRRRDSDLSHVDSDGGDLQFSSTRVLKK
ncbi:hypothetical protein OROMI_019691 [Orobanche minor]